ncbi:hypothetical protein H0H92_013828 [Tricholoma furcatifolium]|nr:hypothetical protein H0H92_013828 [Tricholoma furcatifolium]
MHLNDVSGLSEIDHSRFLTTSGGLRPREILGVRTPTITTLITPTTSVITTFVAAATPTQTTTTTVPGLTSTSITPNNTVTQQGLSSSNSPFSTYSPTTVLPQASAAESAAVFDWGPFWVLPLAR